MRIKVQYILAFAFFFISFFACESQKEIEIKFDAEWKGKVYPAEHEIVIDTTSNARLIFVTTNSADDVNLYFDYNCWFKDLSAMFFISNRSGSNELFTYIPKTGELSSISPKGKNVDYWFATVDFETNDVYVRDSESIYKWNVALYFNSDTSLVENVVVKEKLIVHAPKGTTFSSGLTQSADRKYLSTLVVSNDDPNYKKIMAVDLLSGELTELMSFQTDTAITHVQFNKYNPNYIRFSRDVPRNIGIHRMWIVDTRQPEKARRIYLQGPTESVTHEDWWVNDQLTFCSGYRDGQYDVKVINIHDNVARIVGAGSWWENSTPIELAEYNWWHASGSRDGRWIAADNWHGHIGIIDGRTSQYRFLTKDHRTYGGGLHPHVGWAPDSKSVEFTSNKKGNPDVCIAYLPIEKWDYPFMK